MKEIELLKIIFKDSPDILEPLNEIDKEIERLQKARENDIKYNKYLQSGLAKANNIIKEAREYIEHAQNYGKEKIIYVNGNDILEILDKENK